MEITKDVLVAERSKLTSEIEALNQELLAKDGAVQMIDALLQFLEKSPPKEEKE